MIIYYYYQQNIYFFLFHSLIKVNLNLNMLLFKIHNDIKFIIYLINNLVYDNQ